MLEEFEWVGRSIELISTIITTLLAVWVALLSASGFARGYTNMQLMRTRESTIGRVLAEVKVPRKERKLWAAKSSLVSNPVEEVGMLLEVLSKRDGAADTEAFLLQVNGQGMLDLATAKKLIAAYEKSITRLESRVLFATAGTPAISNVVESMKSVLGILYIYVDGDSVQPVAEHTFEFSEKCSVKIFDLDGPESESRITGNAPRDIAVTYTPEPVRRLKEAENSSRNLQYREYDGHLPWLTSFRAETDQSNGRPRLHLSFGAVTYSRYREDNLARISINSKGELPTDGLMSLSVLALDNQGRILAVRRGSRVTYAAGRLSSFATGNLDLKTRRHLNLDVDTWGLPSPMEAARREMREETGLDIGRDYIHAIGMGRLWSSEEGAMDLGTYHLNFVATTDMSAEDIARGFMHADPVEGAWEVGSEMLAISLPDEPKEVAAFVRWLIATQNPVAQLTTGILHLASARGMSLTRLVSYLNVDPATPQRSFDELVERYAIPSPLDPSASR